MQARENLRNVAIVAHVDHGKTTLVDAMLKQAGSFRENQDVAERVMDSMDQERERGITIAAKNTGIQLGDVHVNVVDTPGHADFGGEVERTLHMVESVMLLVDAAEGPLPQTRFVLSKALSLGLKPIVVINKCDRGDARPEEVLNMVYELFMDLGADDEQLEFPVLYAVARDGWAVRGESMAEPPGEALHPKVLESDESRSLKPLFDTLIENVPMPQVDFDAPLQMQVNAIGYDEYVGRLAIGRIIAGRMTKNQEVRAWGVDDKITKGKVTSLKTFQALSRVEIDEASAGDLVCVSGLEAVAPGDTITPVDSGEALPRLKVDEPTLSMVFSVNKGPFAGLEGKYVTSRNIRDRLEKEVRGNVALKVEEMETPDQFRVSGRGELSLAVLIESMRREGFEFCVSRPEVVIKEVEGQKVEPQERLVVDIPDTSVGSITETIGKRGGQMVDMGEVVNGRARVEYLLPTRGLIGFRSLFLTLTRGEGLMSTLFDKWIPYLGQVEARSNGAIIALDKGRTTAYALFALQPRGVLFIGEGVEVYQGMIIGEHAKNNDLDVNCVKAKQLTNFRAAGKDDANVLSPPRNLSLEDCMEWIDMDELIEVTPDSIRLRKRVLVPNQRPKKGKKVKE